MNDTFYPSPSEAFKTDPPTAREYDDLDDRPDSTELHDLAEEMR